MPGCPQPCRKASSTASSWCSASLETQWASSSATSSLLSCCRRWRHHKPLAKRPGCPYQGHPFMEHGFCCDECQKSGGHGCRCHKKPTANPAPTPQPESSRGVVVGTIVPPEVVGSFVATSPEVLPPCLSDIVASLKRDLGVDAATFGDVVDAACKILELPATGSLTKKAESCWWKVYGMASAINPEAQTTYASNDVHLNNV